MSRTTTLLLALCVLAVALPLAAPTAAAYCVNAICTPICMICIVVLQEVVSVHCEAATGGATTDASCGSWLTGAHGETVEAGAPLRAWARVGPSGHLSYGYALP